MRNVLFVFCVLMSFAALAQTRKMGPKALGESFKTDTAMRLRGLADTLGFAHQKEQLETIVQRIEQLQGVHLGDVRKKFTVSNGDSWRLAIVPHDDYAYAGYMYPLVLKNQQSKTVIVFGVAHKAKQLGVENQLVFDHYTHWRGPYGPIPVSSMREAIEKEIPKEMYQVNDSLQRLEHSVEAELPFLQYFNKELEIVSILVPPMPFDQMQDISKALAKALAIVFKKRDMEWGNDVSLLVSTDAVHYGDEDWSGRDFAFFGTDSLGYKQAIAKEHALINSSLAGDLLPQKVRSFNQATVDSSDFHNYKWTWCGRYSVPVGMLTAYYLQQEHPLKPLQGLALDYCTSLDHPLIVVDDQGMHVTAKASLRHWVGYACVVFR
jgi:AmmeMemoRadiSam system protein B